MTEIVTLKRKVLAENHRVAQNLRSLFHDHGILCLNLISSPGSGKTSLLERTLETFPKETRVGVLTGDIQTDSDARRLERFSFRVRQITTGGTCHLDAKMIERAVANWNLNELDLLLIENVGNLVCPSSYDLGEDAKIVLLSVTEGEDKPLKYPSIFLRAELMIVNKIDLLPYVPFNLAGACENARHIHPQIEIMEVSCLTGQGLDAWRGWLDARRKKARKQVAWVG